MNKLQVLQKMFAAYPNSRISELTPVVYLEVLEPVSAEELNTIVTQVLGEDREFPPSVGHLLERWRVMRGLVPDKDAAQQGWESVQAAIRGIGSWGTPSFRDPVVERTVKAMGWMRLCASDEPGVDQAQFLKMYTAFSEREAEEARRFKGYKDMLENNKRKQLEARDGTERTTGQD